MHRFVFLAGVVIAGACGSKSAPPPVVPGTDDVVTAPLHDPSAEPLPDRAPIADPEPAPVAPPPPVVQHPAEANGRFAAARVSADGAQTFVDVYQLAAGEVTQVSSVPATSASMYSHALVWPDAAAPIVYRGGVVEGDGRDLFGTVTGGRFTTVKPKGKGDVLDLVTSAAGEVWIERCATWDPDNPEEEGCQVRRYYRVLPKPATATKRPKLRVLRRNAVPAPTMPSLQARPEPGTANSFILDCAGGDDVQSLFAGDQVYEPPTWRWLSTEPPIALVAVAYAGMGGGDPEVDPSSYKLLRGCELDENDAPIALGPDGLWALEQTDEGGTAHRWQVMWRGALVATVPGEAFTFAGGVP